MRLYADDPETRPERGQRVRAWCRRHWRLLTLAVLVLIAATNLGGLGSLADAVLLVVGVLVGVVVGLVLLGTVGVGAAVAGPLGALLGAFLLGRWWLHHRQRRKRRRQDRQDRRDARTWAPPDPRTRRPDALAPAGRTYCRPGRH